MVLQRVMRRTGRGGRGYYGVAVVGREAALGRRPAV